MRLKPQLLQETTLTFPNDSVLEWLAELEKGAIAAAAAAMPPVQADTAGRFPEQYVRLIDVSAESVVLCFRRYGLHGDEYRGEDHAYRVPYTSAEQGITFGTPGAVTLIMKLTIKPAEALEEELQKVLADLKTSFPDLASARELLEKVSGRHPLASSLAQGISAASQ